MAGERDSWDWGWPYLYWTGTAAYVAMGDSFSSGAYAPYTATSGSCDRSMTAYPIASLLSPLFFVACSGATTEDMEGMGKKSQPNQLSDLSQATSVVSVTAGGDRFGSVWDISQVLYFQAGKRKHVFNAGQLSTS